MSYFVPVSPQRHVEFSAVVVAPGRCLLLTGLDADAIWLSLWQRPDYTGRARTRA